MIHVESTGGHLAIVAIDWAVSFYYGMSGRVEQLASRTSIAAIGLEAAGAVFFYRHSASGLYSSAVGGLLVVLPWAWKEVDVAVCVKVNTTVHLYVLQQKLLLKILLHNLI